MKNIILMLLKLCISATIIYYVFSGMNIEKIWLELKNFLSKKNPDMFIFYDT